MRPNRSTRVLPGRFRQPAFVLGVGLLLALGLVPSTTASAAEFGPPQVLVHPNPPDAARYRVFGDSLAVDRKTLVATAQTQLGDGRYLYEVFIYERQRNDPTSWRLRQRLSSDRLGPELGRQLALDGDMLALTAHRAVHLFERTGAGDWRRRRTLRPKLPGFPGAISLDGDRLAVGAPHELDTVLIFERNHPARGRWGLAAKLQGELTSPAFKKAPAVYDLDRPAQGFGEQVALSGDRLVVGALSPRLPGGGGQLGSSGVFVFARDGGKSTGWTQLHNFATPGGSGSAVGSPEDALFGLFVSLSGPFLLAGEGFADETVTERTRMHLYERNHRGPDRWGHRKELRRGRRNDAVHFPMAAVVRGNTAALAEQDVLGNSAVGVFERDFPARDRWGLKAHLQTEPGAFSSGTAMALGPRELAVGGAPANQVLVFPRAPILADGFEDGTSSVWADSRGAVEVVSPGLAGSDSALAVELGGGPAFVASNRPRREPLLSLSFSLFPNAVDLGGQRVEILRLFAGRPALRLSLEEGVSDPDYRALLEVRLRDGGWRAVGRARFRPDLEAVITVYYSAATATGAADGATRFEVNGHLIRQVRDLDLDRMVVGRVVLGLPAGSPAAASGSFLVDDFELHR